jgi:hypothetical protein
MKKGDAYVGVGFDSSVVDPVMNVISKATADSIPAITNVHTCKAVGIMF